MYVWCDVKCMVEMREAKDVRPIKNYMPWCSLMSKAWNGAFPLFNCHIQQEEY